MNVKVTLDIPESALSVFRDDAAHFTKEMRLAAAAKWYEIGLVSQGKAAELAGLSRAAFIDALGRFGVSPLQERPEELEAEFKNG